jgi:hypothetical protein
MNDGHRGLEKAVLMILSSFALEQITNLIAGNDHGLDNI